MPEFIYLLLIAEILGFLGEIFIIVCFLRINSDNRTYGLKLLFMLCLGDLLSGIPLIVLSICTLAKSNFSPLAESVILCNIISFVYSKLVKFNFFFVFLSFYEILEF